ncbi:MAG: flagellar protein FlgN [Deltaproteobacteria bacterium]|nr:flagellar protein FlgN [Deltaproteobacteria bacterium]
MSASIRMLLQEELRLYHALKQVAGEQLERIEENDVSGFAGAADRRKEIQESISELDARIRSAIHPLQPGGGSGPTGALRDSMAAVAGEIQALDRRTAELTREKRDQASRSLEQLKQGRKGVRKYGGSPVVRRPRFIDQKG